MNIFEYIKLLLAGSFYRIEMDIKTVFLYVKIRKGQPLGDNFVTLAKHLQEQGYQFVLNIVG